MKIFKRLIYIIQAPIFLVYVMFPLLWVLDIPYWILTGRDLWEDWWGYNNIK